MKKTPRMLEVETNHGRPVEDLIPELITTTGINKAASSLGISRSALYIWIAKLGLEVTYQSTIIHTENNT